MSFKFICRLGKIHVQQWLVSNNIYDALFSLRVLRSEECFIWFTVVKTKKFIFTYFCTDFSFLSATFDSFCLLLLHQWSVWQGLKWRMSCEIFCYSVKILAR